MVRDSTDKRENNGIKDEGKEKLYQTQKVMAISKDIPFDLLKQKCKDLGMTVNEFLFGIVS